MRSIFKMFRPAVEPAAPDARARLRAAMQIVTDAERVLEAQRLATERVKALITAAEEADAQFQEAEAAAIAANTRWAEAGAVGDLPPEALQLVEAAEAARKRAYAAQLTARGAEAALAGTDWDDDKNRLRPTGTLASETDAHKALQAARVAVGTAARDVLNDNASLLIERAQELHSELTLLVESLAGLGFLQRHSPSLYAFAGVGDLNIAKILENLTISTRFPDDYLREKMEPWVDLGKRLAIDPSATF